MAGDERDRGRDPERPEQRDLPRRVHLRRPVEQARTHDVRIVLQQIQISRALEAAPERRHADADAAEGERAGWPVRRQQPGYRAAAGQGTISSRTGAEYRRRTMRTPGHRWQRNGGANRA